MRNLEGRDASSDTLLHASMPWPQPINMLWTDPRTAVRVFTIGGDGSSNWLRMDGAGECSR